ncbi:MAG: hypothetical protein IJ892_12150 [Prevotella sp.]|nr:hypothetical protein [Prevotella sp.]
MKKIITLALMMVITASAMAQRKTLSATLYKEFRPSVITFTDGHKSRQSLTNVFLKNSTLLFPKGEFTMEANMDNILAVDFEGDRSFVNIENKLAYFVDSYKNNALYCIELFDQEAYERNLKNNVNISNLDLSSINNDIISTTTIDLNNEEDYKLPVFRHFYMKLDGNYVKVHERTLLRMLPKQKRTMMKRIMAMPGFSWQNEESLMQLLKVITD